MRRIALSGLLLVLFARSEVVAEAPTFPWASLRAMAQEHPVGSVDLCNADDDATKLADLIIARSPEFYRFWAMMNGSAWVAIHYNRDARPDWVWRGSWSEDTLWVASVSPYDPVAHASACNVLFGARP